MTVAAILSVDAVIRRNASDDAVMRCRKLDVDRFRDLIDIVFIDRDLNSDVCCLKGFISACPC